MEISVTQAQGRVPVTILAIRGEVDGSNFDQMTAAARAAYEAGARHLLIDLSETTYMSSAGLAALQMIVSLFEHEAAQTLEGEWTYFDAIEGGESPAPPTRVKLLNPHPRVDTVLELVGFKAALSIFADRTTALLSFG